MPKLNNPLAPVSELLTRETDTWSAGHNKHMVSVKGLFHDACDTSRRLSIIGEHFLEMKILQCEGNGAEKNPRFSEQCARMIANESSKKVNK